MGMQKYFFPISKGAVLIINPFAFELLFLICTNIFIPTFAQQKIRGGGVLLRKYT